MPRINFKLLREVRDAVLDEPAIINMAVPVCNFAVAKDSDSIKKPLCNTVGCIAGWAVAIKHDVLGEPNTVKALAAKLHHGHNIKAIDWDFIENEAIKILGLPMEMDTDELFQADCWPDEFRELLNRCKPGSYAYAGIVADRINDFILENGGSIKGR